MSNNNIIKSPYNFVPLSEEVYTPSWANLISQDVPFKDGVSGKIQLRITAETPIFIRNGQKQDKEKDRNKDGQTAKQDADKQPQKLSQTRDGRFYIPATSIKGEVRNVLEIMSFGRMMLDERAKFAHREWDQPKIYPLKDVKNQQEIHCGWLRKNPNSSDYEIIDCGKPRRIHHTDLDAYFGKKVMEENFSTKGNPLFNKSKSTKEEDNSQKTMAFKYGVIKKAGLEGLLENFHYAPREATETRGFANCVAHCESSSTVGTIVMTGQSASWKNDLEHNNAKIHEFVFPDEVIETHPFPEEDFEHFKFIYSRDKKEWKFINDRLKKERGCPVFFRIEDEEVSDMGLAFMYKLPYKRSVYKSLLPNHHKVEVQPDLAECIFGYINQKSPSEKGKNTHKNTLSLKGRVQFGHAFSSNAKEGSEVKLTLGSPKASYYPLYIQQDAANGSTKLSGEKYKTYDDGHPSGWKRYVMKKEFAPDSSGTDNTDTIIKPIQAGATFTCDILFHNLRPIELGALLSALTFHNTPGCRHQLGQGKPYGFGKVKYDVELSDPQDNDCTFYLKQFEEEMNKFISNWCNRRQISELITLTCHPVDTWDKRFRYMKMSNNAEKNEFAKARKVNEVLPPFSALIDYTYTVQSIMKREKEAKRQQQEAAREQNEQMLKSLEGRVETVLARDSTAIEPNKLDTLTHELNQFHEQQTDEDIRIDVKVLLNQIDNKKKELKEKAGLDEQEREFTKGFEAFIEHASSVQKCYYASQKWIKCTKKFDNGRKHLNDSEIKLVFKKIKLVYKDTDKKACTSKKDGLVSKFKGLIQDSSLVEEFFKNITNQQ